MELLLFSIVYRILEVYYWVLIIRIFMSWFPNMEATSIGRIIYRITEPYLAPFRRIIPPLPLGGVGIDLSPIVALLAYDFLRRGIFTVLNWVG